MSRFSQLLIDHYQAPVNRRPLAAADRMGWADVGGRPPRVTFYLRLECDQIIEAAYEASGCGVTIACGSVITEMISGRQLDQCEAISPEDVSRALGGIPQDKLYCAVLAVAALRATIHDRSRDDNDESTKREG